MKLSRNVLVGSLATTGMILGLVAPSLTAQAATSSATVNDDGTLTHVTPNKNVGSLGEKGSGLAIAYDAGDGTTAGTATAESNANVKVISGILTLDAVPDMGFGTAAAGSTVSLKDNNYDNKADDSQNGKDLVVTESRAGAPGFNVTAQLSPFNDGKNDAGTPFTLNLKSSPLKDDSGNAIGASSKNVSILADGKASGTVIDLDPATYSLGSIKAEFAPGDDNAFLKTTGSATDAKDAKAVSYNSTITWTLTATPSKDNGGTVTP